MIKLLGKLPSKLILACSGGPDSMAALDFLSKNGKREIVVAYFNHGTTFGADSERFLREYLSGRVGHNITACYGRLSSNRDSSLSMEEFWRNERYSFLMDLSKTYDAQIATCHHLDDQVEQYLFSTLHGKERLIPYSGWDGRVIRPFLLTRKSDLVSWCNKNCIPYMIDPSNSDLKYRRNFIRHQLLPQALVVNPGLHKIVAEKTRLLLEQK